MGPSGFWRSYMLNFGWEMHLMNGKSSMVLTQQQDHLLEDESSIKLMVMDMLSSFVLQVVKINMVAYIL